MRCVSSSVTIPSGRRTRGARDDNGHWRASLDGQNSSGRMKIHTVNGGGGLRLHGASGATRTGGRSCSFMAGRRTISGPSNTARSPTTAGGLRPPWPRHVRGLSEHCEPELWAGDVARSSTSCSSTDRCSSAGHTAPSSSVTTYAHGQDRIAAIDFVEARSSWARQPSAR
jgi:hypothetical protein